jgi:hypothetical protein
MADSLKEKKLPEKYHSYEIHNIPFGGIKESVTSIMDLAYNYTGKTVYLFSDHEKKIYVFHGQSDKVLKFNQRIVRTTVSMESIRKSSGNNFFTVPGVTVAYVNSYTGDDVGSAHTSSAPRTIMAKP